MSAPTTTAPSPLAELELRAGASDQDREAWLAQRRVGPTATEIRDLMLGAITPRKLAAIKLGRASDSFAGNAYTAWGNEREPVIAAMVQERFGIAPESRVFHAADNPRKLASPDGLGAAFDGSVLVSEIKTCGPRYDLTPGSEDFEAKGYGFQIQWNMRVLGVERALFVWEIREGVPGSFTPGLVHEAWVERDDAVIAELDALADLTLAVMDAMASEPFAMPDVDEAIDTHAVNYLHFIDMEREATAAKKAEYDAILAEVGEREEFQQEGVTARVTLTPMKLGSRTENDLQAAIAAAPDLWEEFATIGDRWQEHLEKFAREIPTETKPRLTITAIKSPKEKKS